MNLLKYAVPETQHFLQTIKDKDGYISHVENVVKQKDDHLLQMIKDKDAYLEQSLKDKDAYLEQSLKDKRRLPRTVNKTISGYF